MKLEIKHWSAYLPYQLQLKLDGEVIWRPNKEEKPKQKIFDATLTPNLLADIAEGTFAGLAHFVPVLRPLYDLIKEIEHNGEKIVPVLELYKLKTQSMDGDVYDCYIENNTAVLRFKGIQFEEIQFRKYFEVDLESNEIMFSIATETWVDDKMKEESISLCGNEMQMFEKLKEWHFDIFGLIDAGLAVDINTLKI